MYMPAGQNILACFYNPFDASNMADRDGRACKENGADQCVCDHQRVDSVMKSQNALARSSEGAASHAPLRCHGERYRPSVPRAT
jgi:hypothetical protein